MAGLIDVILRGGILALTSLTLGGVAWLALVARAEPHAKPDAAAVRALRLVALGAGGAALAQAVALVAAVAALAGPADGWPLAAVLGTTFGTTALTRLALGVVAGALALRLASAPGGPVAWRMLQATAVLLVLSSAALSHAVARVEGRLPLLLLDAVHQVAGAVWIGGLAHLTMFALWGGEEAPPDRRADLLGRFSTMAIAAVTALVVAGGALTVAYVGEPAALVGTAYGVMVLSKTLLLALILTLAWANWRFVRREARQRPTRLLRFVEVELGLGLTVFFAAASLTSLPPAVDVTVDRATVDEVAARFSPTVPRLASPPVAELIRTADPLMGRQVQRTAIERAWSEYNHHWAGLFVVATAIGATLERLGVRAARHWPLGFLGLAAFMFLRSDPRAWPLGPAGFWESLTLPDVVQHRTFVVLVVAFAVFEWSIRAGRLPARPWSYVFPLLCAVGGGLLLTHSHAMFSLKDEFLTEVTHAPLGILGVVMGWARWLELRLPESARAAGWISTACFVAVGLVLLVYREG